MALHMISFAPGPAGTPHMALSEAIQAIGPAVRVLASQWLLISRRSRAEILGELAGLIDHYDTLIVASVDPAKMASYNLPDTITRWLALALQPCGASAQGDGPGAGGAMSAARKEPSDR